MPLPTEPVKRFLKSRAYHTVEKKESGHQNQLSLGHSWIQGHDLNFCHLLDGVGVNVPLTVAAILNVHK